MVYKFFDKKSALLADNLLPVVVLKMRIPVVVLEMKIFQIKN